jgi:hypothetical protein
MTVTVSVQATCDRCQKPFEEQRVKQGEEIPTIARNHVIAVHTGPEDENGNLKQVFRFDDLCPKCADVVDKEIKRIRLEKEEKKPNGNTATPTEDGNTEKSHNF